MGDGRAFCPCDKDRLKGDEKGSHVLEEVEENRPLKRGPQFFKGAKVGVFVGLIKTERGKRGKEIRKEQPRRRWGPKGF